MLGGSPLSVEARLQKVMPALSAKERGLLVLGCLKDGTPEDPLWRKTHAGQSSA
jgi:hypothetical protein